MTTGESVGRIRHQFFRVDGITKLVVFISDGTSRWFWNELEPFDQVAAAQLVSALGELLLPVGWSLWRNADDHSGEFVRFFEAEWLTVKP